MSIDFTNAKIAKLITHYVGNKYNSETFFYSEECVKIGSSEMQDVLLNYFTAPFVTKEEFYSFWHESDIDLNTVMHFVKQIFEDEEKFIESSTSIAKHLYEAADSPNIKSGEVYITYIDGIYFEDKSISAVGIYKSENPVSFVKPIKTGESYQLEIDKGCNTDKIDKGCLIFNVNSDTGYQLGIIDQTNKKDEARYWRDNFLKIMVVNNNFQLTKNYLDVCKDFVTNHLEQEYEVNKSDKIDFLNKTVGYFKENSTFKEPEFLKQVFEDKEVINSFKKFKDDFTSENELELDSDFDISGTAVKRQSRVFKSVLKLDKNFHVYIHGDKTLIEKGYDKSVGKNFYKIYFDEEH